MYKALADAITDAERDKKSLAQVALEAEARDQGRSIEDIRAALKRALDVMRGAIEKGLVGDLQSASGLVGGDAAKLRQNPNGPLSDTPFRDILTRALAVQDAGQGCGEESIGAVLEVERCPNEQELSECPRVERQGDFGRDMLPTVRRRVQGPHRRLSVPRSTARTNAWSAP